MQMIKIHDNTLEDKHLFNDFKRANFGTKKQKNRKMFMHETNMFLADRKITLLLH